jgi:hypothetical protein
MTTKIKKSLRKIYGGRHWFFLLGTLPLFLSCMDLNEENNLNPPTAYVSFFNGTGSENEIRIEVDDKVYDRKPFHFGQYIDYWYFFTGERNFSFKNPSSGHSYLDTLVTLKVDKAYTFFMADEGETLKTLFVEDSLSLPSNGKAAIRLVHLSPDTPAVKLYIRDSENAHVEVGNFMDLTDFTELDMGQTDFILKSSDSETQLARLNDIPIREGRIYTLIIRGRMDVDSNSQEALRLQLVRNYPNY